MARPRGRGRWWGLYPNIKISFSLTCNQISIPSIIDPCFPSIQYLYIQYLKKRKTKKKNMTSPVDFHLFPFVQRFSISISIYHMSIIISSVYHTSILFYVCLFIAVVSLSILFLLLQFPLHFPWLQYEEGTPPARAAPPDASFTWRLLFLQVSYFV